MVVVLRIAVAVSTPPIRRIFGVPNPPAVPSLQGTAHRLPLSPRACAAIPPACAPPPPRPAFWLSFSPPPRSAFRTASALSPSPSPSVSPPRPPPPHSVRTPLRPY